MPPVQISVIKGVFTAAQKQEMIKKVTDAMVAVEGESMRGVTWVKVDEIESGNWGIDGQCLTTTAVKDLQTGKAVA
jgi:4-oxalocrotonate tautomerase